jgi:hypothetical protein
MGGLPLFLRNGQSMEIPFGTVVGRDSVVARLSAGTSIVPEQRGRSGN